MVNGAMNKYYVGIALVIAILSIAATEYANVFITDEALIYNNATIGNGTTTAYINGSDGRYTGLIKVPFVEVYNVTAAGYTVTIAGLNTYYPIINLGVNEINHFIVNSTGIIANKTGFYKLDYSLSFSGSASSTHTTSASINGIEHSPCRSVRKLGTAGDVGNTGGTCILFLNKGDALNGVINDISAPAQNINVYTVNANLIQIG